MIRSLSTSKQHHLHQFSQSHLKRLRILGNLLARSNKDFVVPKLETHTPSSLSDILSFIEDYHTSRETVWYRGVNNSSHSLKPSISRSTKISSEDDVDEIERQISATFSQRSPPFLDRDLGGSWKELFFMQHYGIPTRLLDWSESPFVSLYFALCNVPRNSSGKPSRDAALWLCDPIEWNRSALSHISFKGGILDENSEEIKAYAPDPKIGQKATQPVMIYGVHNSPRIVAQRGVFALFGKSMKGMDGVFRDGDFPDRCLVKLIIPKINIDELLHSLFQKGFSESTIFPDLSGLALEIRRRFGFQ